MSEVPLYRCRSVPVRFRNSSLRGSYQPHPRKTAGALLARSGVTFSVQPGCAAASTQGLGFGFRVDGLEFMIHGLEFGFRVWGVALVVSGLVFEV